MAAYVCRRPGWSTLANDPQACDCNMPDYCCCLCIYCFKVDNPDAAPADQVIILGERGVV